MKQETLDLIGRRHTVEDIQRVYAMAREIGFDNINMDLIIGLPGETKADVAHTLEELKALAPDSITVHSLAIKRAARLNMFKDDYKDMQMVNTQEHMDLCADYCKEMGLEPYYRYRQKGMAGNMENVGYAKKGKAGVYNILIMEEKQTIMALGAGATTKFVLPEKNPDGSQRIERVENVKDVKNYLERVDEMIQAGLIDEVKQLKEMGTLGVTLSGGEPLMQMDFAIDLLKEAKKYNPLYVKSLKTYDLSNYNILKDELKGEHKDIIKAQKKSYIETLFYFVPEGGEEIFKSFVASFKS